MEASTRRRLVALVAAAALLALAGCIGSGGDEAGTAADPQQAGGPPGAGPGSSPGAGAAGTNLTFPGPAPDATVRESGTFAAPDGAWAGGGLRGADTRTHDLTSKVPTDVPVVLNVTVTYPGDYTQINADLSLSDVEVYQRHGLKAVDKNTIWLEARLARIGGGGTVEVVVQADTTGPNPELNYTVTGQIDARPEGLVPRVPATVPISSDAGGLVLEPGNGTDTVPPTKVWGPDGSWVDKVGGGTSGPVEVDADATRGRYALLVEPTGGPGEAPPTVRVRPANSTEASPGDLGVAGLEASVGSWHGMDPGGEANWTFEASAPPAAVGVAVRASGGGGATAGFPALEATVSSPAGEVAAGSQTGIWMNYRFEWMSTVGDANLVPGTYEVTASQSAGTPAEAAHVLLELER